MKQAKTLITDSHIQRGSTLLLKTAITVIGAIVLAVCIFGLPAAWRGLPQEYPGIIGAFHVILLAMYAAAVPFYVALYQAWRLLRFVDQNKAFSEASVAALKAIKYCAIAIGVIYCVTLPSFYAWAQNDDAPGLVIVGMATVGVPLVVAVFAAVLQRLMRQAIAIKSENDLTV